MPRNKHRESRTIVELFEELRRYTGEPYTEELQFGGPREKEFIASLPSKEGRALTVFLQQRLDDFSRRAFETLKLYYASFSEIEKYLDDEEVPAIDRITFLEMYLLIWRPAGAIRFVQSLYSGELLTLDHKPLSSVEIRLLEARLKALIESYTKRGRVDSAIREVEFILRQADTIESLQARLLFLRRARINFDAVHPGPASGAALESERNPFRRLNDAIKLVEDELQYLPPIETTMPTPPVVESTKATNPILRELEGKPEFSAVYSYLESLPRDVRGRLIWQQVQGDLPLLIYHVRLAKGLVYTREVHKYTSDCFVWSDGSTIEPKDLSRKLANMDRGKAGRPPGDIVAGLIASLARPAEANKDQH